MKSQKMERRRGLNSVKSGQNASSSRAFHASHIFSMALSGWPGLLVGRFKCL